MKGIPRKVDQHGRITVPLATLRSLGLGPGMLADIYVERDVAGNPFLVVTPAEHTCILCGIEGAPEDFVSFRQKRVCNQCIDTLCNPGGSE